MLNHYQDISLLFLSLQRQNWAKVLSPCSTYKFSSLPASRMKHAKRKRKRCSIMLCVDEISYCLKLLKFKSHRLLPQVKCADSLLATSCAVTCCSTPSVTTDLACFNSFGSIWLNSLVIYLVFPLDKKNMFSVTHLIRRKNTGFTQELLWLFKMLPLFLY